MRTAYQYDSCNSIPLPHSYLPVTRIFTQLLLFGNYLSLAACCNSGIQTCDQPMPKAYPVQVNESYGYGPPKSQYSSEDSCLTSNDGSRYNSQISMIPYISPRLTPAATPKIISTDGSPRSYSVAGSPKASGFNSPTKYKVENRSNLSWYSSSQLSSAASSPPKLRPNPGGRTTRTDGKEFFRQASCGFS